MVSKIHKILRSNTRDTIYFVNIKFHKVNFNINKHRKLSHFILTCSNLVYTVQPANIVDAPAVYFHIITDYAKQYDGMTITCTAT